MWVLIAFLIGLFTDKAQAQPTVSVGVTVGNTQPNGIWWQQEYPSQRDKTAPSFSLRWDRPVSKDWQVGLGYAHIGNFHWDSQAVASDEAYAAKASYPTSRWIGDQKQDGLFVVAQRNFGPWYIEAGPMLTRTTFEMRVPDWVPCVESVPRTCLLPDPAHKQAVVIGQPRQMRVELVAGVGYQVTRNITLQANLYPTRVLGLADPGYGVRPDVMGGPGILKGYSCNISMGYTFR